MNAVSPKAPATPTSKNRRTAVLLALMLLMAAGLGWDYWTMTCHDNSLARLQAELQRRQALKMPLPRNEVAALLSGSPKKTSNTEASETDFYSWRGLIHHRHISVEYDAAEAIVKVDDAEEIPPLADEMQRLLSQKPTPPPARKIPQEDVEAALNHAAQLYSALRIGDEQTNFQQTLINVFDGLPELKVSTDRGKPIWNSFQFSRQRQRFFAFRFTVPEKHQFELDYVRFTSPSFEYAPSGFDPAGTWQASSSDWQPWSANWQTNSGIVAVSQRSPKDERTQIVIEKRSIDGVPALDVEGDGRPSPFLFGTRSLKSYWPSNKFILWFHTADADPSIDFQYKVVLFASEADKFPPRKGAYEISEHIGLKSNLPKYTASPDGIRAAVSALEQNLATGVTGMASYRRIFQSVLKALPEVTVGTTPGESHWQKVEFPYGRCSAVRVRIPDSMSGKVDLYGAIQSDHPCQFGWNDHDLTDGDFQSRNIGDGLTGESPSAATKHFKVFSQTKGILAPGQEFVLWFRELDDGKAPHHPLSVTLTAVPHLESLTRGTRPLMNAEGQPWSCGKLLGIETPKPLEPTGCRVLGWHEENMTYLAFSPDSRRLVSVDLRGDARVWNVESQKLESEFLDRKLKLAYDNAGSVLIAPDSQTLLTFDTDRRTIYGWNLDSRERTFTRDVGAAPGERLQTAAFGSLPNEPAMILQQGTLFQSEGLAARCIFGNIDNGEVTETPLTVHRVASQMLYLPSAELFAVGFVQYRVDPISQQSQSVSVVRLYSEDFSTVIQELPLGNHPIERLDQADNSVRLSLTPDGRRLAAIDTRGQLKVWDVTTKTELLSKSVKPKPLEFWGRPASPRALLDVSLSPDGEIVMTTSPDENWVTRWNIADGQPQPTWQTDEIEVTHIAHSPDGNWVATANTDGVIRLWKNTYQDAAFLRPVADVPQSEKNVGTPKPSTRARAKHLEQFIGKWSGKWNDKWKVQITISKKLDSEELELLYEWEKHVGEPLQRGPPRKTKIETNVLVSENLKMTLDADNPQVAIMIGKFQNPVAELRAVLSRESR